jgi:hypothetical protein
MATPEGGVPSPPPSTADSFRKLLVAHGKKLPPAAPPSFVKKLDSIPEIDLPPDHPMCVAVSLSDHGLVGQFMGLWPSTRSTDNWIQRNWRPLIQNSVTCYAVGRGFFIFEFISQEDRDLIFRNRPYFMGTQGLYLNRWTPSFDPAVEVPKDVPVWVRLPNLPIHCWNPTSLQAIENGLGHYIDRADPKDQYSCMRICVEVDLEVGLPEAIKLKVGDWQHYQKLDYEQLSFKCRGCHEYGHFQRNFPKDPNKEKDNGEGWQQPRRGRASSKEKGPRNEKTNPSQSKEQGNQPETMTSNRFRGLDPEIEKSAGEAPQDLPIAEAEQGKSTPEAREEPMPERVEEQGQTAGGKNLEPEVEEGEVSSDSDSEGASDTIITPIKIGRGRKSKKEEREKETYKDVLSGSQPTIRQLINVRQTRKHSRAPQGAHISPPGKS